MKKIISSILAASICIGMMTAVHAEDAEQTIRMTIGSPVMTVDGTEVSIDDEGTAPVIVNERTLVPIRAIIEAVGGTVDWDGDTRTVTLACGGSTIELAIDSETAYLNGMEDILDTAPTIINERTMLPIRYIAEGFGLGVEWNGDTETVTIIKRPAVIEVGDVRVTMNDIAALLNVTTEEELIYKEYYISALANSLKYGELAKKMSFAVIDNWEKENIRQEINEGKEYFEAMGAGRGSMYIITEDILLANMLAEHTAAEIPSISDEELKEYFVNNYYRAKHILIDLDEELAKDVLAQARNGADFDKLIEQYNADPGMAANPDGYIFTEGDMVQEFEDCVKSLNPGEFGICKTIYGRHIIERLPLSEQEDKFNEWFEANKSAEMTALIEDELINRLEEACKEHNIEAKINWDADFAINDPRG